MDRTQGSAVPALVSACPAFGVSHHAPRSSSRLAQACGTHLYRGSSPRRRRRGRIRTAPALLHALGMSRTVMLELPTGVYSAVGCWRTDIDYVMKVEVAYQLYYPLLRPAVCDGNGRGGVGKRAVVTVAAARARYADWRTGRNSRPSVATLVHDTGLSESTVQRATRMLRLLGAATEVFRGRQRTRVERFASWRSHDRGRGWASVYALHPPRNPQVSRAVRVADTLVTPHPVYGPFRARVPLSTTQLDATGDAGPHQSRAPRDSTTTRRRRKPSTPPDPRGLLLARRWRQHPDSPAWARRHSLPAWARVLARVARADWAVEDLHQLVRDHISLGGWIAANPRNPLALMGWLITKHDDLEDRPAAADMAREAAMRSEAAARRTAIAGCVRCGDDGYLLAADGTPVEPVVRCRHQ